MHVALLPQSVGDVSDADGASCANQVQFGEEANHPGHAD